MITAHSGAVRSTPTSGRGPAVGRRRSAFRGARHLSVAVWVGLLGCAGAPAVVATAAVEAPPSDPTTDESVRVAAVVASAACRVPAPSDAPPSVLVEHELPPPPPPPPRPRRRGERRVIQLDFLDGYGPLHVTQVLADGTATHLGQGSDPRTLPDGTLVYIEHGDTAQRALVRVAPDGPVTRTPGGAGRMEGLGGPLAFWRGPFSPDGRFQARPTGSCAGDTGPCAVALFVDDPTGEGPPLRSAPLGPGEPRMTLAVKADGSAFSGCVSVAEHESRWIWVDTATGAQTEVRVPGFCSVVDMEQERVVVMDAQEVSVHDRQGGHTRVHASLPPERVLLGPCAEDIFVVGERDDVKVVERIALATGAATTLGTLPIVRQGATDAVDVEELSLDAHGWLLVTTTRLANSDTRRVWLLRTRGTPQQVELPAPAGRVFGVYLGPLGSLPH